MSTTGSDGGAAGYSHGSVREMHHKATLENAVLNQECELLTELLMLKHYKNLTDNRLNMSSARRRSIPQKKPKGSDDLKLTDDCDTHHSMDADRNDRGDRSDRNDRNDSKDSANEF